jgi:outer membrane immunogenic protein
MNRILIAGAFALAVGGAAFGADLPPPPLAPASYVPIPASVYNWSGIYLGINGGYATAGTVWNDPVANSPGPATFSMDGFQVGGTIGANYQLDQFVLGIEGDGDWSNQSGSVSRTAWIATVRGRAGYVFDRVLFYASGGAAIANRQAGADASFPFASTTQVGWTAGAGIEAALWQNWTAKVEYLYVDLGNQSCPVTSCAGTVASSIPLTENVIRGGINYRFNF